VSEPEKDNFRRTPAPRQKVEIRLTATQAEKLRGLWEEHSGPLHAMLVGWCGDPQNASDVLQEVFRRLAGSPGLMAKMNNARAFLAVSARRVAVDFARRGATRVAYHTAAGAETPASENPGPTDENLRAVIAKALDGLPAEQRSVFEHKILNGRTLNEISRLEGVSLNTVSSRLRYALDKIRGQLRPYYDDLNRKDFKLMKNDPANTENIASQRIITPLAPKRVPSVAPGLEGLAAMAPDACEAAPEIAVSEPDFVEASPAVELVEPEIANCGVGGNAWEQAVPEVVELPAIDGEGSQSEAAEESGEVFVTEEIPEMISCEILPEGGIPEGWLRPILVVESPEDLLTTLFEGESESGTEDGSDLAGEGEPISEEAVPYELESGFEICVLPVPEDFSAGFDPNDLLARYEEFLSQDPTWLSGLAEGQGDWFYEQVTTASAYFEKLEFGTPGEANAFDHWFASNFGAAADGTSEEGTDYSNEQPDYADGSWSFDPKDLLVRYEDFLRENPDWGALDPDMMEIQVVTPSSYFGELEFGTPSKAAAFDSWLKIFYVKSNDGGDADGGGTIMVTRPDGSEYGTIIRDPNLSGVGGMPAEWLRGGTDQAGILYNSSGGIGAIPTTGLALSGGVSQGGGVPTLGEASQTVVTGGTLVTNEPVEQVGDNTLTLSNGSKVVLEGGQVVSGENVYAYNPEFGSGSLPGPEAQLGASELPTEIAITGDAVVEAGSPFGSVASGLASTPGEALIVEFGVLSPSEPLQAPQMQTDLHASDDLPQSVVASSGGSAGRSDADAALSAALDDATLDNALPHVAASAQESELASNAGIKVDAPTAAAGAVAAGTVVHGGAAAPALRRPLPTL
jgi:RNA polymerase sigma-70 factor, ECF subfamily